MTIRQRRMALVTLFIMLALWIACQPIPLFAQTICEKGTRLGTTDNSNWVSDQPSISGDGRTIAFWSTGNFTNTNADGNIEIFAWRPFTSPTTSESFITLTQVTSSTGNVLGGYDLAPSITKQGDYVSFISDRNLITPSLSSNGNFEIYMAELDTAGGVTLTAVTESKGVSNRFPVITLGNASITFSPNKLYLPLISKQGGASDIVASTFSPQSATDSDRMRIFFMSDAKNASELGANPVGFNENQDQNSEVFLAERALSVTAPFTIVQLTDTKGTVTIESLSADESGGHIAYVAHDTDNDSYTLSVSEVGNIALTPVITITSDSVPIEQAHISGDGKHLVFLSTANLPNTVQPKEITFTETLVLSQASGYQHLYIVNFSVPISATAVNLLAEDGSTIKKLQNPSVTEDGLRVSVLAQTSNSAFDAYFFDDNSKLISTTKPITISLVPIATNLVMNSIGNDLAYVQTLSNTATISAINCPIANIQINTGVDNDRPNTGDSITYTIKLTNSGPDSAKNVTITHTLPNVLEFKSASNGVQFSGNTLITTVPKIEVNTPVEITFTAKVLPGKGLRSFQGDIFLTSSTFNRGEISTTTKAITVTAVNLSASITVNNQTPKPKQEVTYTVVLRNDPYEVLSDKAEGIILTIRGLDKFEQLSSTNQTLGSVNASDLKNVNWTIPEISANQVATLTISVKAKESEGGRDPFTVLLTNLRVKQDNNAPQEGLLDATKSATIQVLGTDLEFGSYTVKPTTTPNKNSVVTYSVVLTNNGPQGDRSIFNLDNNKDKFQDFIATVSMTIPTGLTCNTASFTRGGINTPIACANPAINPVVWTFGTFAKLPVNESVNLEWSATVISKPTSIITPASPELHVTFQDGQPFPDPLSNNGPSVIYTLTVQNQPPTIDLVLESPEINEGQTAILTVDASDDDGIKEASIGWGDTMLEHFKPFSINTRTYTHRYAGDSGNTTFPITVIITDTNDTKADVQKFVTVKNVAPTIRSLTIDPSKAVDSTQGISPSTVITLSAFFTDPALSVETFQYEVKWGDNSSAPRTTIIPPNANDAFAITHTYTISNSYTITVTVNDDDDDGTSDPVTTTVYVHN